MMARSEAGRRLRSALRPPPVGAVPLRRLDRWQAETMREQLADLYVESSHAAPGQEYHGREEFLSRLAADVRRPGFAMVIAQGPALVGCAFGFSVGRDGSWWGQFGRALPGVLERLTASGHVFALAELTIHPHEHDQDLGRRLQEGLFADQQASLAVTKVERADAATFAAFLSRGWTEIGESGMEAAVPRPRWLAIPLDERTLENPDGLGHDRHTPPPEGSAAPR
jgi:hypothetical protein